MHHPTDRMTHTTDFVTPVVEHWLERDLLYGDLAPMIRVMVIGFGVLMCDL